MERIKTWRENHPGTRQLTYLRITFKLVKRWKPLSNDLPAAICVMRSSISYPDPTRQSQHITFSAKITNLNFTTFVCLRPYAEAKRDCAEVAMAVCEGLCEYLVKDGYNTFCPSTKQDPSSYSITAGTVDFILAAMLYCRIIS